MEKGHFRDFSEFCEQLNDIKQKFHKWDSCEKTVALYYLMVGLPFGNARFLQHALEQCIMAVDSSETQLLEENANNSKVVSNFLLEQPQVALSLLLTHLPLLKPYNRETAKCYLKVIKQVLLQFITPPLRIYNECVELMSYLYIHPAFSNEDKQSFKNLLKHVINKVSPDNFIHSPANESSDESVSPNPDSNENIKRLDRRSNSLTPTEELGTPKPPKTRSFSLCSEKLISSGIKDLQESKSDTKLQELILANNLPALKSIISWLKSLRLHKYSWVFNNLSYSRMINLTDEDLQTIGITKGARHKLLLNIIRLKDRSSLLTELEFDVISGADLNGVMKKLRNILQTPLEVSADDEDLPRQFVRVMGKICTQLLMIRQPSEEYLTAFSTLCERADSTDAFTDEQKKRLNVWNSQLLREEPITVFGMEQFLTKDCSFPAENKQDYPKMNFLQSTSSTKKSSSFPNMQSNTLMLKTHRHSVGSIALQNQLYSMPQNHFVFKKNTAMTMNTVGPSSQLLMQTEDTRRIKQNVHFQDFRKDPDSRNNTDIESSLESLCIQMTEHALGP